MTLLPAGACPSRRASLPTYLTPLQSSTGTDADSGGQPFLPIESKSSRGYPHVTRFVTGATQSPSSSSRADAEEFRSNFHGKEQLSPAPMTLVTRSLCSSSTGLDNAGMDAINRRRGSSANSKGHNVNFQRVCNNGLTINNEVGDLPSSVSHLIGRTKEAECVKALHIVERQSYEDEDVWPATTAEEDGSSSSSHRSDGFDQRLWDRIMSNGQQQLNKGPSSTTSTSCHSDATELVRRSTDPQLSSTPHNQTPVKCVRADANERCKRIGEG